MIENTLVPAKRGFGAAQMQRIPELLRKELLAAGKAVLARKPLSADLVSAESLAPYVDTGKLVVLDRGYGSVKLAYVLHALGFVSAFQTFHASTSDVPNVVPSGISKVPLMPAIWPPSQAAIAKTFKPPTS